MSKVSKRTRDEDDEDYEDEAYEGSDLEVGAENSSDPSSRAGPSKPKSKRAQPKPKSLPSPKIYQIAKVDELAIDEIQPGSDAREKLKKADGGILERIRKALSLANHPNTGEAEAKQALRLSTRLMASQNLTQADLIAEESEEANQARAGLSTVIIRSSSGKRVTNDSWVNGIAKAICGFFDVKCYSTSARDRLSLTWSFYGLAVNSVAAATAFEIVHNQVLVWASQNKSAKGKTGKNSYCNGVAAGLIEMAKAEKADEERKAIEAGKKAIERAVAKEKEQRLKEVQRLEGRVEDDGRSDQKELDLKPKIEDAPDDDDDNASITDDAGPSQPRTPPPRYSEIFDRPFDASRQDVEDDGIFTPRGDAASDAGDSEDEVKPDFDDAEEIDVDAPLSVNIKTEPECDADAEEEETKPKIKPEPPEDKVEQEQGHAGWQSSGQLIQFRQNAQKIADDFLKRTQPNIRLGKGRAFSYKLDKNAYNQGVKDAKKIDVKRRRIEE